MIEAACHRGAVRFTVDAAPDDLNDCACSICRRYGALWAYYQTSQVSFAEANGVTDAYVWNERILEFHRCRACGCLTHWEAVDKTWPRMGVNARMMPAEVVAPLPVRHTGGPE